MVGRGGGGGAEFLFDGCRFPEVLFDEVLLTGSVANEWIFLFHRSKETSLFSMCTN